MCNLIEEKKLMTQTIVKFSQKVISFFQEYNLSREKHNKVIIYEEKK